MDFKILVKPYQELSLETLKGFINIDSVYDPKTVSSVNPYGIGVTTALNYVYNLAKKDGFAVKNLDNRVVEIYFGDKNLPNIGVFAHADVVPATGDWVSPPFDCEVRDGKLYGRGTSDDKGPAIAAYYAIKALFDNKLLTTYSVRLVIGGDEERGSSCMHYYFHEYKAAAPLYGFTPDAEFPLIYAEKAITNFMATKNGSLGSIAYMKGGEAPNSVIDKMVVVLAKDFKFITYLEKENVKHNVTIDDKNMTLTFIGKSAHGSLPSLGVNAGLIAFKHLGHYYKLEVLSRIAEKFADPSGKTIEGYFSTPLVGETTYNVGLINFENELLTFVCNFRYPETVQIDKQIAHIQQKLQMDVKVRSTSKLLLFDPKSEFIQTLLKAYQDETGDLVSTPLAIGGGTYAKECPNTVAFGSAFTGRSGDIHQPNEHVLISDIYEQTAIYARAIYYLGTRLCA